MIAEMKDNCSFYSIIALCFETPNGELLGGKKRKRKKITLNYMSKKIVKEKENL